jgi:hypothetical protein
MFLHGFCCNSRFDLLKRYAYVFPREDIDQAINQSNSSRKDEIERIVRLCDLNSQICETLHENCGYRDELEDSKAKLKDVQEREVKFLETMNSAPQELSTYFPGSLDIQYSEVIKYAVENL